jgi:hypothetical protein
MQLSNNYGLKLMEGTDNVKRQDFVDNFTKIDTEIKNVNNKADSGGIPYVTATGTANTYAVTLSPAPTAYTDGMRVTVKINVASTGASTLNINSLGAKTILDSLGNAIGSGGLKANIPYQLCYNGTNFIVLGKGGGGNVTADKVLSGYTFTNDSGQGTGTIPSKAAATYNPSTSVQTIASGQYVSGTQAIAATTGTATADTVLSGYTFNSGNGIGLTGNIPNNYGVWQYSGIPAPGAGRLHMYPPKGYYDPAGSTGVYYDSPDYLAQNIVNGKNIFGVVGTATLSSMGGANVVSGTVVLTSNSAGDLYFPTSLLPYTPSFLYCRIHNTSTTYTMSIFDFIANICAVPGNYERSSSPVSGYYQSNIYQVSGCYCISTHTTYSGSVYSILAYNTNYTVDYFAFKL